MQKLEHAAMAPTALNPLVGDNLSETLSKIEESIQGLNELACDAGVPLMIAQMLDVINGAVGVATVQWLSEKNARQQGVEPYFWIGSVVES